MKEFFSGVVLVVLIGIALALFCIDQRLSKIADHFQIIVVETDND